MQAVPQRSSGFPADEGTRNGLHHLLFLVFLLARKSQIDLFNKSGRKTVNCAKPSSSLVPPKPALLPTKQAPRTKGGEEASKHLLTCNQRFLGRLMVIQGTKHRATATDTATRLQPW